MKILYITEIYPDVKHGLGVWGGGEKQFYEISTRVAKRGHEVAVLTCRFPGQSKEDSLDGVTVFREGLSRNPRTGGVRKEILPVLSYMFRTAEKALELNPDLIHCNTYFPVFSGKVVARIRHMPLVTTFHDIYRLSDWVASQQSLVWGLLGHIATVFAARVGREQIISVSPQCKQKLMALGIPSDTITVIPNGIDMELLNNMRTERVQSQILYVGRLVRLKHVDRLIYAFRDVLKQVPEANLKIVGDGPERSHLQGLVRELGLTVRVSFTGVTPTYDAVARYLKESTIFVLPSTVEGESVAAKEAMGAGLPVIAMNVKGSGVLSLVRDGENGFLVEPGNQALLVERMIELLRDEGKRREMGAAAGRSVAAYDWKTIADRTLEVYQQIMK